MAELTISVKKEEVYEEVAKTTSYTGAKIDDAKAYERIFTTDEDKQMLERFWDESKSLICNNLKKVLVDETESSDGEYTLTLALSTSFEDNLINGMQSSLFSYFVMNITSKWYTFANKGEAKDYEVEATANLEDIMRKVYHKKKPTRPIYN